MTKQIPLTQGKFALVDDEDFELLNQHNWYAMEGANTFYAARMTSRKEGPRRIIRMHTQLLGLPRIDHKNKNGLDNRRDNLREASHAKNSRNRSSQRGSTSNFLGVSWKTSKKYWEANIRVAGKRLFLGYFGSEVLAAQAYDKAALQHFGEFASLNLGH